MLQRFMAHVMTMEAVNTMEDVDTIVTNPVIAAEEGALHKTTGIGTEALVVEPILILNFTVRHT